MTWSSSFMDSARKVRRFFTSRTKSRKGRDVLSTPLSSTRSSSPSIPNTSIENKDNMPIQQRPTDMLFDGPMIEGTWFNPDTGDRFTVRDSFFEDNNYTVLTTDGRTLNYNQIQNYIKDSSPNAQSKPKGKSSSRANDELPPEVLAMMEDPRPATSATAAPSLSDPLMSNPYKDVPYADMMLPEDMQIGSTVQDRTDIFPNGSKIFKDTAPRKEDIITNATDLFIDKALKDKAKMTVSVSCDWTRVPVKEIDLLVDVMGVTFKDIAAWYASQLDLQSIYEDAVARIESDLKKKYDKAKKEETKPAGNLKPSKKDFPKVGGSGSRKPARTLKDKSAETPAES